MDVHKYLMFVLLLMLVVCVGERFIKAEDTSVTNNNKTTEEIELDAHRERLDNQTKNFEKGLKNALKGAVKSILPSLMEYSANSSLSGPCMKSFMKYISDLTSVKVWAVQMLDATSKPPAGIFEGTLADFGAFDQCLNIEVPLRKWMINFRGKYCTVEIQPIFPPIPKNFSLARQQHAKPLDTIGEEVKAIGGAFYYMKFRFGLCVPSTCSLDDMRSVAKNVAKLIDMNVHVPKCYVKENTQLTAIHFAVICVLGLLLLICIYGSIIDYRTRKIVESERNFSMVQNILLSFSLISNYKKLLSASKGAEELKALHGIRVISMAWVILGHTYVWTNFQLMRRASEFQFWFTNWDFEIIHNGWLAVETFFFLSGLLTCYAVLKVMQKTEGKLNVPAYIFRRYIRLTPPLLLTMGLIFFLPVFSSGPFWYERVDPELKACTTHWWANIIYISNWLGLENICVHPTWYLSADFQLHIVSIAVFYALYRSPKIGLTFIAVIILVCSIVVGVLMLQWDLPPTIQISSGNVPKIQETIDIVHIRTFTHAGPYYIGIIIGYLMIKCKDIKISKLQNICGWIVSIILGLTAVFGAHRWNSGDPHGSILTCLFGALHRATFTVSVAWVAFACVTGHGGIVNKFLSSSLFAPFSRLTFLIYLLHSLVLWTRKGTIRDRSYSSHYNVIYEYFSNVIITVLLTVPFYLLLEAPLSNLERLLLTRKPKLDDAKNATSNGHAPHEIPANREFNIIVKPTPEMTVPNHVELTSVKSIRMDVGYHDDIITMKNHRNKAN